MKFQKEKPSVISVASVTLISSLLTACGGGTDDDNAGITTPSEPIQITSASWKKTSNASISTLSLEANSSLREEGDGLGGTRIRYSTGFTINGVDGSNIDTNKHWQIYIDMDNNQATGYQATFKGSDYLIEDGIIYQSTADDDSWSWKTLEITRSYNGNPLDPYIPEVTVEATSNQLNVNLSMDYLYKNVYSSNPIPERKDWFTLCNHMNIGFTERDKNWQVDTYYPLTNQLLNQTVEYCNVVNQPPKIEIIGSNDLVLDYGTPYVDPGVIAIDAEDGDLTHLVTTSIKYVNPATGLSESVSEVGPALGKYFIRYIITDSAGISIYTKRSVDIITPKPNQIVVDGNGDEWTIDPLENADGLSNDKGITFYGTRDKDNIILMVKADDIGVNTQIYINTNSNTSGYQFETPTFKIGTKILIENNLAYYFVPGSIYAWSWQDAPAITVARSAGVIELSIPKTMLINSTHDYVDLAFASRDQNWKIRKNSLGEDLTIGIYKLTINK